MKIGIVGSRRRNTEKDKDLVRRTLKSLIDKGLVTLLVSGACKKGADRFAEELADEFKIPIAIYPPDTTRVRKGNKQDYAIACWERNSLIADNSDILIAVVAKDRKGGTEDTIKKFLKKNSRNRAIILEEK